MRVLVVPTAFKGSIGAAEVAAAMARGVRRVLPAADVGEMPLSDGGPGLLDALRAVEAEALVEPVPVTGPLGEPAEARLLWLPGAVAVIESADACGLHLVAEGTRDALAAHTLGVGEAVSAALTRGAARVVVGLGGSATTDGGTGMARAFGWRFLDRDGEPLPPGGGPLARLAEIRSGRAPARPVTALADVETRMAGARGAARTFGPQKGATAGELERLVDGLERLADRLRADLAAGHAAERPGSGAAGGLGSGMAAFLGAELVPGSAWVLDRIGFDDELAAADLLVTGEGAWDPTSATGKVTGEVLGRARDAGVEAALVCARIEGEVPPGVVAARAEEERLDVEGLVRLTASCLQGSFGGS